MIILKRLPFILLIFLLLSCESSTEKNLKNADNPFLEKINVPIDYAKVTASDVEAYAEYTVEEVNAMIATIKDQESPTFANVFEAMDDIYNKMTTTSNNCFMLYWVSTDSLTRAKGLAGYQLLDSVSTALYSDKGVFSKMMAFKSSPAYGELKGNKKLLVDDLILSFEFSGVNLEQDKLQAFKKLYKEINQLSTDYSGNMNSYDGKLALDENGAKGLPEEFKNNYKVSEGRYEIPVINATNEPVMSNATMEETRKAFFLQFNNRAADKNLSILDSMVRKRDELAKVMGYPTFAAYNLSLKMAKNPETVWNFLNDLIARARDKAKADVKLMEDEKKLDVKNKKAKLQPWDVAYYKNQILKGKYEVNNEELREYFPMDQCLKGMFAIYQKLLGLEFRKVDNASVWHEEVELYEVFEGEKLKGRFYLDLYPRPNKETWFYGVSINSGKATTNGYEVPVAMLLGNFTRPTKTQPSLLSQNELNTLFHEFGHIMNSTAYHGEYSSQSNSKADFVESMSQLFENWLFDYDILNSFAKHYKTGEPLPKETFDKLIKAKNVNSGVAAIRSLQRCLYDMNLYDKYRPEAPIATDKLWADIDQQLGVMNFYEPGTHPQASWIHINTHPVYMYGYLWSEVYAQDMFTEFEKNGLTDTATGVRYRELILANGTQRDIVEAVEEFLGRPSNNAAYIKSLGLE